MRPACQSLPQCHRAHGVERTVDELCHAGRALAREVKAVIIDGAQSRDEHRSARELAREFTIAQQRRQIELHALHEDAIVLREIRYREVTPVRGLVLLPLRFLGHEPRDRLLHEPVQLRGTHLVGVGRDLPVHPRRCLLGEAAGAGRDAACLPHRQTRGRRQGFAGVAHPGEQAREPVLQLQAVGDDLPAPVGAPSESGGELGDAELRDCGCARTGEGELGVLGSAEAGDLPGGGVGDRLRRVLLCPGDRREEDVAVGALFSGLSSSGELDHLGS